MYFRHLTLYFSKGKIKTVYKQQRSYVPFIELMPLLKVVLISGSIGLEAEILIWKTENIPTDLKWLLMNK